MQPPRLLALAAVSLAFLLAPEALAREERKFFKNTVELGGGPYWPVAESAFRDNYSVGGLGLIRWRMLGETFTLGLTGIFGGVGADNDALRSLYASRLSKSTPDLNGGGATFAGALLTGDAFFVGTQKTGGAYAMFGAGFGGVWASPVRFGTRSADGSFSSQAGSPSAPAPAPFKASTACALAMAGVGATTGTPSKSPYVSFGIEAGPTLVVFDSHLNVLLGFTGTIGFFL
jgi:hypothetical protein